MPRFEVVAPDGRKFEVNAPEGATQQDAISYVQRQATSKTQHVPVSPTDDMSGTDKFLAGIGRGFVDLGRGAGQMLGLTSQQEIDEARKRDAPLMDSGAGIAGNVVGGMAAMLPALAVPGANSLAGAAALGGAMNALQPTAKDESRLRNVATGAALGGAAQYGLGKIADFAGKRLAAQEAAGGADKSRNAVRDSAISDAQAEGYKTVPSVSGGSMIGRVLEGLTGKEKAKQLAAVNNQTKTDALARKALGLPDDAPLTKETMRAVRAEAAAKGYEPVRALPRMETDSIYLREIRGLTSRADNASKDFGALVQSDVKPLADELANIKSFTGDTAVDAVSVFREKASDFYASGNKTLGKAYRQAAEAIEGQIERGLARSGKDGAALIKDFRAARARMAQSFDLEKAIREGQGRVDARTLGKLYEKNPNRMTGDLAKIGRTASAMPEVMAMPKDGWSNPVTALDAGIATFGGILAGNPAPLAYPALRAGARYGLMSGAGQRMFATPQYGPGAAQRIPPAVLEELERRGLGGLLGSVYAAQE